MKSKPREGKNTMVGVMIKVALKIYWNQRNAQKLQHFPLIWVDSDWMTLLVLTFKTSSTLFLCSPSPNAASSTKMGSHIESYASISLCFILAYRASSLWTTFPTSHCKHTKSALLLRGNRSLPHSEGKGVLLFCVAVVPANVSSWMKLKGKALAPQPLIFPRCLALWKQKHGDKI